jgi:histidinol-phosphate/aromatic aminotransferase/cobyric acid decarboxylase-like protein
MTMFEYTPSGTSRMTRRKLFSGVALSSLGLSSVGTVASSASLATAPAAGLRRLSLNENPFGPSPLAVEAIQNALTEIARYPGDDAHALEQQIAYREGVSPDQIILGEILDTLGVRLLQAPTPVGQATALTTQQCALVLVDRTSLAHDVESSAI